MSNPFVAIAVTVSVLVGAVSEAQSEMAPAGEYLSGPGTTGLPSPKGKYRTRLAWVLASYHDNVDPSKPIANILNNSTIPPLARQAIDRELGLLKTLPGNQERAYYRALVEDYDKLELRVFR